MAAMSDDRPQTLDEAWKQIDRLHLRIITLEIEIGERQHDRITALEAAIAVLRGTLSRYDEPDDQPIIVHDCPPDAPR